MSKTALIIIFNHRYDKNIPVLEKIYQHRFRNIYYLVPFYDGDKKNVIPVFGNSYYYSTYIAQGYNSFFNDEHQNYLFVADDMAIPPTMNEDNVDEFLGTREGECFIPEIRSMHEIVDRWHTHSASVFELDPWGVEASAELPSFDEAVKCFAKHNLAVKPITAGQIFEPEDIGRRTFRHLKVLFGREKPRQKIYHLKYPVVAGFSDFMLVPRNTIAKFCHYCGVLGAMELFVEMAIPTAMVLSAERIRQESTYRAKYLWNEEVRELDVYGGSLKNLFENFPADCLLIHPVKLSAWKQQ